MQANEENTYYPPTLADWRAWLAQNHRSEQSVWLILYKKKSERESILWSDAVDVALCFGWIDSKRQTIDEFSYRQFYCRRKPKSPWSKINKEKVQKLIDSGEMRPAGYEAVEIAKANGSWTMLDEAEALIVPEDLETAFQKHPGAKDYYLSLSPSNRKSLLHWIALARRPETRQKRIDEISEHAGRGERPKHFR
ncbi:YdeI/OmpD-associated family protein [Flavilitoribacter nigricans]|uniref:Bacteriocin-protection protein n=1 Tax=Flavilitoribacter nigricans (strain ATCC 23147 / DSM 23189 / NBRC 102662 / NCIMB 1420 / SS-2) TaxID=1122177 RepID=A0A2D0N322_FLAN2|nr:YdeI/OmpD-associated family protein [Flavilitoribacter nigricans]PHN02539.1 hypothetical protein CRP01_31685 [Flavilitoribacter nigricans DSM 23189 = NBRC 102662]